MTGNKSAWAFFTENSTRTLTMLPSIGGTTLPQAGVSGYVNMSKVTLYAYPSAIISSIDGQLAISTLLL